MKYSGIKELYSTFLLRHRMRECNKRIPMHISKPLTKEELMNIKNRWNWLLKDRLVDSSYLKCYSFYKHFSDNDNVNANLVPSDFYYLVTRKLNTGWGKGFLSHKANLHFFIPESNRPITIVYNVSGCLFDKNDNILDRASACSLLLKYSQFVYKKALYTGGGKGVKKYSNPTIEELERIVQTSDFIIQEIVQQSDFFSQLNSSSVNTIRMETLNLHNKCSVLSSFIRIGAKDSFVDNISGRDGMVVGIDDKGRLCDYGLTHDYSKVYRATSGVLFKGLVVPDYERIKETVCGFHLRMPMIKLINWDIAIDSMGNVLIIEVNLDSMNPLYHQVFNGPIFHERTEEVMSYMTKEGKSSF